jgi:hypothetical protein
MGKETSPRGGTGFRSSSVAVAGRAACGASAIAQITGARGGAGASRASSSANCSPAAATAPVATFEWPLTRRNAGRLFAWPHGNRLPASDPPEWDCPLHAGCLRMGRLRLWEARAPVEEDVWHSAAANADATAVARPAGKCPKGGPEGRRERPVPGG